MRVREPHSVPETALGSREIRDENYDRQVFGCWKVFLRANDRDPDAHYVPEGRHAQANEYSQDTMRRPGIQPTIPLLSGKSLQGGRADSGACWHTQLLRVVAEP